MQKKLFDLSLPTQLSDLNAMLSELYALVKGGARQAGALVAAASAAASAAAPAVAPDGTEEEE